VGTALLVAGPALAQTRSHVTGSVRDSSGALLPDVTILLDSPDLVGGTQTVTSDERGVYRFVDLPPGVYEITGSRAGFQTVKRTGVRLLFGTTATVDLVLGVGGAAETLTVEGRSPAVDVTTAQSTSKIDADLIQSTPTVTDPRNGLELMAMSPGINARSALGGARDANEVLFDGTPTTLPERQGTNAAVINSNWMQEIQVVSLGASAEYGEFSGAVVNFVTRSGSNDFRGMLEYRKVPGSWISNNVSELSSALATRFTPAEVLTQWDTSAQLGGPIMRDKLFFFTGFQYIRNDTQAAGVPAPNSQKQWRALGKLSWAASKDWRLDGTLQTNKVELTGGASTTSTADVGTVNTEPNTVWNARATWTPNPQTLLELRTGGLSYEQTIDPKNGGRNGPSPRRDTVTGISSVNGATYRFLDQTRLSFGGSVTRFFTGVLGRQHELKLGVDYNDVGFYAESGIPSGLSFTDRSGVPDQVLIWSGDVQEASGSQTKLYVQDGWKVTDRLTLEPGLRVTWNRGSTPTAGDVYSTTPVSPRLGVAWDVTRDHKTVARAHYGRYHEAFGTVEFQFTDTARQTVQITSRVLGPNNFQELTRFTPAGNQFVDESIKQPYMDQYLVGVERELFADFAVNAQYIQRESKGLFGWLDTRSVYAPVQVRDPGPDNVAGNADDGELLTAYNLTTPGVERRLFTNPDGAWRRYRAFQLILQKRFSKNWQLLAGYTRAKAEGSVNNGIGDNYGSLTVTASPFINPNNAVNATGRNTMDFPHELVIRGSYHAHVLGGFNVGAVYRYISGQALSRTAVFRLTQGNTTLRVTPRGSLPTDAISSADLRLDKTFALGAKSRRLSVFLDIYNVNNQGVATGLTEASGATYGVPSGWSTPRTYQLAGRLSF
jgi:hypothetical protein